MIGAVLQGAGLLAVCGAVFLLLGVGAALLAFGASLFAVGFVLERGGQ